ncbi:hypothetical protein TMatcc_006143 [Talaromyces marneffei ATCC 18224]
MERPSSSFTHPQNIKSLSHTVLPFSTANRRPGAVFFPEILFLACFSRSSSGISIVTSSSRLSFFPHRSCNTAFRSLSVSYNATVSSPDA